MQQLPFLKHEHLDLTLQLSTQLASCMEPLALPPDTRPWDRAKLITLFLNFHELITKQGYLEHSGDWDPSLTVTTYDGTTIGGESGYDIAQLQGDLLLLEHPNEDGESPSVDEDCYYSINIMTIASLEFNYD